MGICESDLNSKGLESEFSKEHKNKHYSKPNIIPLKKGIKNSQKSNLSEKSSSSNEDDNKIKKKNIHPHLEKYEPSLARTSELSNCKLSKSDIISKSNGEEIIIRGKINSNYQNKEFDFDNPSFMKLVKSNGGKAFKEDNLDKKESNNKKDNGILYDFEKDEISEIKSQSSLGEISNSKNTLLMELNGLNTNNEIKSQISKGKYTNYSLAHKELNLDKKDKFDNKSKYTTKTIRQNTNINRYLNGILSNKNNSQNDYNNHNNTIENKYSTETFKPRKDSNKNNIYKYQNSSKSIHNNNTNATINEKLTGSSISPVNNKEKNPSIFNQNNGNVITNISPL